MHPQVAGYLLQQHAFDDAVSAIWHGNAAAEPTRLATLRIFDVPEDGELAGPLFAFRDDVEAAARLDHPHVLETRDVGREGIHTYVVSRHTPAVPLAEHLRGTMTPAQALELLGPLAEVLDDAARGGLPHGAVHPRSIWVEPVQTGGTSPRALLTGFGLHHILRVIAVRRRDADAVEDFLYVAPELLRGGRPTNRSDQYALAAALLHAMIGSPPFAGARLGTLFGAQRFGRPPSVGQGIDDVAALDEILLRALAKNPDRRFDTCVDFFAAVLACNRDHLPAAAAEPVMALPSSSPAGTTADEPAPAPAHGQAPGPPRARRWSVMRDAPALAVAGLIVGIVAALVLLAYLPQSVPPSEEQVAAATTPAAAPAGSPPPGLRWRQTLETAAKDVYVLPAGVVAVTPAQVVVLDPATGRVSSTVDSSQASAAVTADGGLVTAGSEGLQVRDVADGTVAWTHDITGVGAPEVSGDTIYRVSNEAVPQLVATDVGSGQPLWRFPDGRSLPADTAVAAADGFVYLADAEAVSRILPKGARIDGGDRARKPRRLWRASIGEPMWPSSLQAVADGVVTADRSGNICLLRHQDGDIAWCFPARGVADVEPVLFTDDATVYVVTDTAVTALDTGTGNQRWMRAGAWRGAVMADDGRVVAVDGTGHVSVLAADTGSLRRLDHVRVPPSASLSVAGDVLYAAGPDGTLISVDLVGEEG